MKYALFNYTNTGNIGDEIQSIAAEQHLPHVDYYIDRDNIGNFISEHDENVVIICNGYFGHNPEAWPPSASILPILVSLHISCDAGFGRAKVGPSEFMLSPLLIDYLRAWGPVGARDLHTLRLLEQAGVPCYFSGCVTLTLPRDETIQRQDLLVLNDVPEEIARHARERTKRQVLITTHADRHTTNQDARFAKARQLLFWYQAATGVITTRLHCALPCLAMGTPVLLLTTAKDQERFSGLNELLRCCSPEKFLSNKCDFDVDNPEPNSNEYLPLRHALRETIATSLARLEIDGGPKSMDDFTMLRMRYETLLALHAERAERVRRLEKKLQRRGIAQKLLARM